MEDQALYLFFQDAPLELWRNCIVIERGHENMWQIDLYAVFDKMGYIKVQQTRGNIIFHLQDEPKK